MRLAILSDAHANLEALQAVFEDIEHQRIEKVVFLGDAVGYGANPNECIRMISDQCDIRLLGNHDYVALGLESPKYFNVMAQQSIYWTREVLEKQASRRMADFEMEATFLNYHFVHATPEQPMEWNYLFSPEDAARNFECFSQSFCFIGHTHLPAVYRRSPDGAIEMLSAETFTAQPDCRYLINVGSVGQPRDGDSRACYLIADTDTNSFEYHRVEYDLVKAQKKMKKAQLPEFLITRLENGK